MYDYVIQPAWNCAGPPSAIDIGVFAHEFGHAFGLPDLYDTNSANGVFLNGEKIQIYGSGEQLRDFNYVDDVVDAFGA